MAVVKTHVVQGNQKVDTFSLNHVSFNLFTPRVNSLK